MLNKNINFVLQNMKIKHIRRENNKSRIFTYLDDNHENKTRVKFNYEFIWESKKIHGHWELFDQLLDYDWKSENLVHFMSQDPRSRGHISPLIS